MIFWVGRARLRARAAGGRQATVGSAFAVANKKKERVRSRLWVQKNPCFRIKLIEELDVLCRLAAKYKGVK